MTHDKDHPTIAELLRDLKAALMNDTVTTLKVIQALKDEAGIGPGESLPGTDLLFQLAKLQLETTSRLATVGSEQTDKLVNELKARRQAQRAEARPQRALIVLHRDGSETLSGGFQVKNQGADAHKYPLPDFVHLCQITTKKDEGTDFYLALSWKSASGEVITELDVPKASESPPAVTKGSIVVADAKQLGVADHYRGHVLLTKAGAPSIELIVEILPKKP